jgi:queuine tRNA-ribosyltransferase
VRCADAADLVRCGVPGLVMNSYHLLTKPGLGVLRAAGGLHAFAGWQRPILTDSGGFQVFSLIRENPKYGEIRKNEIIFRPEGGHGKMVLTPEKCVQAQFVYGSDIMMCLDYCTHPDDPYDTNAFAVDVTVAWAARCKAEYEKQLAQRRIPPASRPLLFAIIQGGGYADLRRRCAEGLRQIGFDGYGFGGWPLDAENRLVEDILACTAQLMPDDAPKYAMGLGKPEGIAACRAMGYGLFDCVIPTREARHNRLYVFENPDPADPDARYHYHYMADDAHARAVRPVSPGCDCPLCAQYSAAYLRHLCKAGDSLAYRLATLHNLRFYETLMEKMRQAEGGA